MWHRDSSEILAPNEITRFPHAVLEIKLELKGEDSTVPKWVTDLQNSGLLYEVHKFSKFIHGCSVLLPEDVQYVPYWVDDASLRDSIFASKGERILVPEEVGVGPGANVVYDHLLPFGDSKNDRTATALGRTANTDESLIYPKNKMQPAVGNYGVNFYGDADLEDQDIIREQTDDCCGEDSIVSWLFPFCSSTNAYYETVLAPTSVQKIEPKIFFANERTYLHWLHSGVTLYTIASGILAFSEDSDESWAHWYALFLLPISLGFCLYALHVFLWRADRIKTRVPGRWDDPRGPMLLGGTVVIVLAINFVAKLYEIATYEPEL